MRSDFPSGNGITKINFTNAVCNHGLKLNVSGEFISSSEEFSSF
jgi:hypothetical protein